MKNKKIGIITFHNSYNCGSMLESYAMLKAVENIGNCNTEIINFSNIGQQKLYNVFFENNSLKNIIKNIIILPFHKRIAFNNSKYEEFKNTYFKLSNKQTHSIKELTDNEYDIIISGSDQIWNITIVDGDDAYFLPWVKKAKKIAYAPSFGAKKIQDNTTDIDKYKNYLNSYNALSIRENNGQKWIKELINKNVPVLIDPTLLLSSSEYDKLLAKDIHLNEKYIFFYSPGFDKDICKYVQKIAKKYNLQVITWSSKQYYLHFIKRYGFKLPKYENPSSYLNLIKNAELIITTSFHGTVFSTIYKKKFITVKNGGMYTTDDRVITLLTQLQMMDRLIPPTFNDNYDYLQNIDYTNYDIALKPLQNKAINFLTKNITGESNETSK